MFLLVLKRFSAFLCAWGAVGLSRDALGTLWGVLGRSDALGRSGRFETLVDALETLWYDLGKLWDARGMPSVCSGMLRAALGCWRGVVWLGPAIDSFI